MPLILYRWLSGWGLPSISPACIQIEAYLRLCQADFEVESCSSGSTSPSGQLPALETPQELVDAAAPSGSEFDSARAIVEHLRHSRQDLDAGLSPAQKAEAAAFAALVEAKLEPAVLWTTWCEAESFSKHTQAAYGAGLPFPLNYILPYTQRRRVQRLLKNTNAEKVYSDAAQACSAITERLSMSSGHGPFFFGAKPCSFDALLYGLLAFQQASPVTSPEMKQQIMGNQALTLYVSRISNDFFSAAVPTAPPSTSEEWQARAQAAAQGRPRERQQEKKQQTAEEQQMQRRGWYWLAAAGAAVTAFVLLSGQYVTFDIYPMDMELDDEEDDE